MRNITAERALLATRLNQIATGVLVAVVMTIAFTLIDGVYFLSALASAALVLVALTFWLNHKGRTRLAGAVLLSMGTLITTLIMWFGQGVFGGTLIVYPVILIFAAMLAGTRYTLGVLAFMLLSVAFIAWATVSGLRADLPLPLTIGRVTMVSLVLVVCAFSVWLLSTDLRNALVRLESEVERVHASQRSLAHLARYDALTDLPNRVMERERLDIALAQARRLGTRVAMMFVDLDNFKTINDSMGHAAGDEFLRLVAQRLVKGVRETDSVSRHGGDEFLIVMTNIADKKTINYAVAKLMQSLAQPVALRDTSIQISCSIGIAFFPDDGGDFDTLLRLSDIAMYSAKNAGRNTFRYFDRSMSASLQDELNLTEGLRQALLREEFVLHYQPVLDLESGSMVGAEALVRWQHPQHGLIPPAQFIPLAEKSGLIVGIGEWVLNEACRQMAAWRTHQWPTFVIAVNLSVVQFRRGTMAEVVRDAIVRHNADASCLELELTESTLIQDSDDFVKTLHALKKLGVKLTIDDFGTGYSNLAYLQRFEVDKLKVDQSFVRRLSDGPKELAMVRAIVQMAKSLGLTTTAEGIEDEATRQQLAELGCDQGQGYLFARPLPVAQFEEFMQGNATIAAPLS
jgi:diguanylate cyclase